jgi:hypothetical protein
MCKQYTHAGDDPVRAGSWETCGTGTGSATGGQFR